MSAPSVMFGRAAGWLAAPAFGVVSFLRHARTFHPRGPVLVANVIRHDGAKPEHRALAERLVGHALVRFSGALWKNAESMLDVLGCAIRFRHAERETPVPDDDDQDLLFATIRRPWTMPFAPFTTNVRDYLANDYFAVSPFDAALGHRIYLRLHPEQTSSSHAGTRDERLSRELERASASLTLDVGAGPFGPWSPVVRIELERAANVDGEALRFRPFRDGRGVRPRGFVHALRRGVHAVSQWARPRGNEKNRHCD